MRCRAIAVLMSLCFLLAVREASAAEPASAPTTTRSLEILSATWAAGTKVADVTDIVAAKVKDGELRMTVRQRDLGKDPAPGTKKILTIVYVLNGVKRTEAFEDLTNVTIGGRGRPGDGPKPAAKRPAKAPPQPEPAPIPEPADRKLEELRKKYPTGIVVLSARWGRDRDTKDVTDICQRAVDGDSLTIPVNVDTFGGNQRDRKKLYIKYHNGQEIKNSVIDNGDTLQEGKKVTAFVRLKKGLTPVAEAVTEARKKYPQGLVILDARWGDRDNQKDVTDVCQAAVDGDSLTVLATAEAFLEKSDHGKELQLTYWDGTEVKESIVGNDNILQVGKKVTSFVRMGKGLLNLQETVSEMRKKTPDGLLVLAARWGHEGRDARDVTELCQRMVSGDSFTFINTAESFGEGWANDRPLEVTYWDGTKLKSTSVDLGGTVQVGKKITSFVRLKRGAQSVDETVTELRKQYPTGLLILDARWGKDNSWRDVVEICQAAVQGNSLTLANRKETFNEGWSNNTLRITYYDGAVKETSAENDGIIRIGRGAGGAAPAAPVTNRVPTTKIPANKAPDNKAPIGSTPPTPGTLDPRVPRLEFAGEKHLYLPSIEFANSLLLNGKQLTVLKADGFSIVRKLDLQHSYVRFGERKTYFVGIRDEPMVMDLIDKVTGKPTRTIKLQYRKLHDMVLLPASAGAKPLSFVSVEYATSVPRDRIVIVDEQAGEVTEPKGLAGTFLQIDRAGQYLWVGIKDLYQEGVNFHINPDWRVIEIPQYGNIDMLVRFDIVNGQLVKKDFLGEAGGNGYGIRVSPDGKRVCYMSFIGFPAYSKNLSAWNAMDFSKKPVTYEIKGKAEPKAIAFHPVIPLVAIPATDGVMIFGRDSGDEEPARVSLAGQDLAGIHVRDAFFSADGLNVILDCTDGSRQWLQKLPLVLSPAEKTAITAGLKPMTPMPKQPPKSTTPAGGGQQM